MKKLILAAALFVAACSTESTPVADTLNPADFKTTIDGKSVELYTIEGNGIVAQVTNYGARLVSLFAQDREGNYQDVVWGHDSIDAYLNATDKYSGPIVGRYGNRINKGRFYLDGKEYQTEINNGVNHLHGGSTGFSEQVWECVEKSKNSLLLKYVAADGEGGYPGELTITVRYTTTADAGLHLEYSATTDKPTVINPTSHCYFNIDGSSTSILPHQLQIKSSRFTPTDDGLIPTGEIATVAGTPLDFRKITAIGDRIDTDYEPLKFGAGYDHNWIFDIQSEGIAQVTLYSPASGIVMEMYTDQPALQFYSGNFMDGVDTGKRGDKHNYRTGIALEAQNYPDAPNHSSFPSSVLRPGEKYTQSTTYKFSTK